MSNFYIEQLKLVNDEIKTSEIKFMEYLKEFYGNVSALFAESPSVKTLATKFSQLNQKKMIDWYTSTYKDHGDLVLSLAGDGKNFKKFCDTSLNILPIIKPSSLLNKSELEDEKNGKTVELALCIRKYLPLLYIYSTIIVTSYSENSLDKQLALIKTKNVLIDTIKNTLEVSAKPQLKEIGNMLSIYSKLSKSLENKKQSSSSIPKNRGFSLKTTLGPILFLMKNSKFSDTLEVQLKQKVSIGLQSGALEKITTLVPQYYVEKKMQTTADVVKKALELLITKLKGINYNGKVTVPILNIVSDVIDIVYPEISNGNINPKDLFSTLAEKVKASDNEKARKLEAPLQKICEYLDGVRGEKPLDVGGLIEVFLEILSIFNNCSKEDARQKTGPLLGIIEKIKGKDGSIDMASALSAINDLGGIDKILELGSTLLESLTPPATTNPTTTSVSAPVVQSSSSSDMSSDLISQLQQQLTIGSEVVQEQKVETTSTDDFIKSLQQKLDPVVVPQPEPVSNKYVSDDLMNFCNQILQTDQSTVMPDAMLDTEFMDQILKSQNNSS